MTVELAQKTFGTKLKRGAEYVAKLLNIDPPEMSREDIDATNHDSPDEFREFIPGLKNGGEVPLEGHLIPGNETQKSLLAALDVNEPEQWVIEFPTNPKMTVTFMGYVKAFKAGAAPVDGLLTFTSTIKVTGKPVIDWEYSAGLTALVVTGGTALDLSPAFANDVYEYFASVATEVAGVTVTPTGAEQDITVNGAVVISGEASGNIALTAGTLKAITIVAKEADKVSRTYIVKAYRAEA